MADLLGKMGRKLYYFQKPDSIEIDFVMRHKRGMYSTGMQGQNRQCQIYVDAIEAPREVSRLSCPETRRLQHRPQRCPPDIALLHGIPADRDMAKFR